VRIFTLGTENRNEADLSKILSKYQIHVLADIRRSTSRRISTLRREDIQKVCKNNKVEYLYLGNELGSERESGNPLSIDQALYDRGLSILKSLARTRGLLIICHERNPYRCNRRFIADKLAKEGMEVIHLLDIEEVWTPPKGRSQHSPRPPSPPPSPPRSPRGRRYPSPATPDRKKNGKRKPPLKKKTSRSKMDKIM